MKSTLPKNKTISLKYRHNTFPSTIIIVTPDTVAVSIPNLLITRLKLQHRLLLRQNIFLIRPIPDFFRISTLQKLPWLHRSQVPFYDKSQPFLCFFLLLFARILSYLSPGIRLHLFETGV